MSRTVIGCDLSRSRIDFHVLPSGEAGQMANTSEAIGAWLSRLPGGAEIVHEPTSGCDTAVGAALAASGHRHFRVNPRRAREAARAFGVLAKTDRVDARVLAEMGQRLELIPALPPEPARRRLAELVRRRRQLVGMRTAELVRLEGTSGDIRADIRSLIAVLDRRIARIAERIERHIADDPGLADDARLCRSVPGLGPVVTPELLAELPELGRLDRRRIASLAGLAPLARDSGSFRGARRIWGGRRRARRALYLAALSAVRHIPRRIDMRARMQTAGKAPKTILIAVARHLLVMLNAMFRNRELYRQT